MKLFWRLLLWFLAANTLTAVLAVLLGNWFLNLAYSEEDARRDGHAAVAVYANQGSEGLSHWLRQQWLQNGVIGTLRGPDGHTLGRIRPPSAAAAAPASTSGTTEPSAEPASVAESETGADSEARAIAADEMRTLRIEMRNQRYFGFSLPLRNLTITDATGKNYRWTASKPPRHGYGALLAEALVRSLVTLLVIGTAAWLAARRIVRPIDELERASVQLAGGDLAARVDTAVAERHDELGGLGSTFNDMAGRIAKLVDSHRRLLRDVSHELRTPLARLRIAAELARERGEPRHFERIEQELEQLTALIQQLLLLARLDDPQGAAALPSGDCELAGLLEDICDGARIEAQQRNIEIALDNTADGTVRGSALTLRSAFENILRNALRFTPDNGVVRVILARESAALRISISDQGPGVPAEALETIFRPFVRVSSAREREDGDSGIGLGLTIAEAAVRAHGGSISARNLEGGGLCIEAVLPVVDET